ncbi:hypothetical protein BGZ57DRAFT_884967 [Hyaloscypha finlandica]|nr:hypothetical protein BGZ57DRAFT_884967 [Hyaloscypha finlandica]
MPDTPVETGLDLPPVSLGGASNPPTGLPLPSLLPFIPPLSTLLLGCFCGIGLTALLPPGVLVALVLTNSCSAVASRRFLGLISPPLLPSTLFTLLSIRGIESDRRFEVVAARVDEDDGIMMGVSGSGSGSCAVCLHECWLPVASNRRDILW